MSQDGGNATEIRALEVDAYSSVHDMIHAAIISHGPQATLREIYRACEARGRIAYKRSGGSRLITQNEHWKSQIRHALYTCSRFARAGLGEDYWTIAEASLATKPATCKVIIRGDDDPRGPQTPGPTTVRFPPARSVTPSRRPPRPASAREPSGRAAAPRVQHATRAARAASPHLPPPSSTVKGRRSGSARPASRFANRTVSQLGGSIVEDMEETADASISQRASFLHSRSQSATGVGSQQGLCLPCAPENLSEGEDESSHTAAFTTPASGTGLPQRRSGYLLRGQPPPPPSLHAMQSNGAGSPAARAPGQPLFSRATAPMTAPRPPDVLQSSPHHSVRMPPQLDVLTNNSTIRDKIGKLRRAGSAEAESPPIAQAYTARLRSAGPGSQPSAPGSNAAAGDARGGTFGLSRHHGPPVSSGAASLELGAGSVLHPPSVPTLRPAPSIDAASDGPIKKRYKAAAKAAAAADAAAQEVDSAHDSAAATTTVGGYLLQAVAGRGESVDRAAAAADGATATDLRSTAAAELASKHGRDFGGGDRLPDCDSPCSVSGQQQLAAMGGGPAAAALARRKGLRARPPAVEGRRPQLIDNFRAAAVGGRAAAAGGRAAKALPPMYHADRLAPSATDNITNAMAFDYSMSQAGTSSVVQPGWQPAGEQSRCAAPSIAPQQAVAESEPRWQLRSQQAPQW